MSTLRSVVYAIGTVGVSFVLPGSGVGLASDGAYSIPDYGIELTVPASGSGSLVFAHPAYEGARAQVRIDNGQVLAGTDGDALTLATYDPDAQWNDEMSILLMDVDFDGFQDIGVLDGVGYGGVNTFWTFYRADAEQGFVPVGTVSNPQRDDIMGSILSESRSGPVWTRDVYRYGDDRLELQFSRTFWGEYDVVVFPGDAKEGDATRAVISQIAPDPWDEASLEDPMFHVTALAGEGRSYFYEDADEQTRRDAYLVDGDVARVLEADETGQWLRVRFTHNQTRTTTEGWMRAEDLTIVQG